MSPADSALLLRWTNQRGPEVFKKLVVSQVESDENGAFVVEGLVQGTYTVLALTAPRGADDSLEQIRCAVSVVEIGDDGPVVLDFDFR